MILIAVLATDSKSALTQTKKTWISLLFFVLFSLSDLSLMHRHMSHKDASSFQFLQLQHVHDLPQSPYLMCYL